MFLLANIMWINNNLFHSFIALSTSKCLDVIQDNSRMTEWFAFIAERLAHTLINAGYESKWRMPVKWINTDHITSLNELRFSLSWSIVRCRFVTGGVLGVKFDFLDDTLIVVCSEMWYLHLWLIIVSHIGETFSKDCLRTAEEQKNIL